MADINQTPEQLARDHIDAQLEASGWKVQHNKKIDFNAGLGIAIREYQTDVGPAPALRLATRGGSWRFKHSDVAEWIETKKAGNDK